MAQMVKCLPTVQETPVQTLGREDLLEKEMATHSSILAWKIPWREEPGRLQSMGLLATEQLHFHFMASQVVLILRNLPATAGDIKDAGLIPGL